MVECIDKTELAQKIQEVLIHTQFIAWIEPDGTCLTAEETKDLEKQAVDYYLGHHDDKLSVKQMLACNRFHTIVVAQTAMIMRLLDV